MLRKNSFAIFLFSAAPLALAGPQPLDVMPAPAEVNLSPGRIGASGELVVMTAGPAGTRLRAAIERAERRWGAREGEDASVAAPAIRLIVDCASSAPEFPRAVEDESYSLSLGASKLILRSATDIGALRGIETFLQLARRDGSGWYLPVVDIQDRPRFAWRGLMIDVARRWQPMEVIKRNLVAMSVVKLNVLHLHLTDDQGFRIESTTHPELQRMGSDGLYFTQAQMREIIAYAAALGIRVVPEFDTPGHASSWVVAHPELASMPGPYGIERQWGVFNPVLDPTNEATYALLADFFGEMAGLFPDAFVHIGGDENNGVQWNANPAIQAFIRSHQLGDNAGLHVRYNTRVDAILAAHGKRLVGWDEISNPSLPHDCVIDSWRGTEAVGRMAAAGYDCILSNGYYIDLCYPAANHYLADPIPQDSALTAAQRAHILGGEATMWSEWVGPETIDSRIWPRTGAVAERLWSPGGVRDVADMYRRLAAVSARLDEAGALHERNRDLMLRHLVGENLNAPGVGSLRVLVSLLEPVKHYERGSIQIWSNQLVPLVGLADAVQPESETSREFAARVESLIFARGQIDPAGAAAIGSQLAAWAAAAREIEPLSATCPAVREALPAARALALVCETGSAALRSLVSGVPIPTEAMAEQLASLERAAAPNESATELPVLGPARIMVAAAASQTSRDRVGPEAWRSLVQSAAAPRAPAKPQD